jgi:uncharacterized membrane protein YeaQ/YmgE (transglycosylase-associated protein family)
MSPFIWIASGLLAGLVTKAIIPGYKTARWFSVTVLGILGALIGGSLHAFAHSNFASALNFQLATSFTSIPGLAIAILGAIIAIFCYGLLIHTSL